MKDSPTFSICIPNYNYGHFIGDTIQSVLDQSYQQFEIIVADNASTDNSLEVVRSFADPRIRLIENRYNIGFAPNLQKATMFAQCDYVNLLSSDDQMKPQALEAYARVIQELGDRAERLVLFAEAETFDNENRVTGRVYKSADGFYNHVSSTPPPAAVLPEDGRVPYTLYSGREVLADSLGRLKTFAPFLTVVYARSLWNEVEGYQAVRTIGPDKFFHYKLLALDPLVAYVPLVLYRYRDFVSPNRAAQLSTIKQQIDDYLYTIEMQDPQLVELGLSRQRLIHTFLDRVCLNNGLYFLGRRNYWHAVRLLAFAFASYPQAALRMPKTYALLGLLATGPLALLLAPALYGARQRGNPERYQ